MHSVVGYKFPNFSIFFISANIKFIISKLYVNTGIIRLFIDLTFLHSVFFLIWLLFSNCIIISSFLLYDFNHSLIHS